MGPAVGADTDCAGSTSRRIGEGVIGMLPTFLVIGAMKAGTDSLYEYLRHHPQVFMATPKELDFFVEEKNWACGPAWYEAQFEQANGALAIGEASTSYAKHPVHQHVPERIASLLPDVRLIYLVRQPIERIRSEYLHRVLYGGEQRPIEEAVLVDPSYLDLSRYALQIEHYLAHFSRDQLLVVVSEDLRMDRRRTLEKALRFLGVDDRWTDPVVDEEYHRTSEKVVLRTGFAAIHRFPGYRAASRLVPAGLKARTLRWRTRGVERSTAQLSESLSRHLEGELRDDVGRLRTYLGREFDGWGIG